MRKTIYEWLDANRDGKGLAKKKSSRRKSPAKSPRTSHASNDIVIGINASAKKKRAAKKATRKNKPR